MYTFRTVMSSWWDWPFHHCEMSLFLVAVLVWSLLCLIIVTSAFLYLHTMSYIYIYKYNLHTISFIHLFTSNLSVSLLLKCISCRKHVNYMLTFLVHSDNLKLLIGMFNPLIVDIIMYSLVHLYHLAICSLFVLFISFFSFPGFIFFFQYSTSFPLLACWLFLLEFSGCSRICNMYL